MGDLSPPPLAASSLSNEPVFKSSDQSPTSPTGSHETITQSQQSSTVSLEPELGPGSAMFSTDLGRRALRRLQGPPYAPVLVHSDMVQGVVTAAGVWRSKFPYQYLCIFPQAGWQIGDLWDEEDIHLETEPFCREILRFIERDNCIRAQDYAQDWSKMHPERLHIVGGDMTDLYNKRNPLSIVDKIFVNKERRVYPPIFLWHVAHIMRTAMLAVKGVKLPAKGMISVPERLNMERKGPVVHGTAQAPATVESIATLPTVPSTRANSSTHVVNSAASVSAPQPILTYHSDRPSPPMLSDAPPPHGHHADPIEGGSYAEPVGHMMPGVPGYQMGGPNLVQSGLRVPRNRPGRSASGTYNQIMSSGPYVENMPHVPSGPGPRQHASPMPIMPSPRLNQGHMTMNHPMVNVHHGMVPFRYEQAPMASGMIAGQPLHPGMMHPSMMPPHSMQSPLITHGYSRQPSGSQGPPYAAPMGDMTNMHYSPGMPPQNIDPRRPGDRRFSQQHVSGSALYDPYEGSNPAFRAGGYPGGKKYNQNGLHNSSGRQRKASFPGSRPYHSQYTNDRSGYVQPSGNRFSGSKGHRENDLAITQDLEHGCHMNWIGPQNITVNELFIKDLPEDIRDAELEALFHDEIGVKPNSVNVGSAPHLQHTLLGRKHAFVGFSTAAIARQAINIRDPAIRGLPVSITVPKRFFQKIVEVPLRDAIEAGPSAYSRYTSNPNNCEGRKRVSSTNDGSDVTASTAATKDNLAYSPQDVRSDLYKIKKGKQPQQVSTSAGSPETRKAKPKKRQESLAKEKLAGPTEAFQNNALNDVTKADDHVPASNTAKRTLPVLETQTEQPQASEDTSSKTKKKSSPTAAEDGYSILGALGSKYVSDAASNGSNSATDQQQQVVSQEADPQPQQETYTVEPHIENSKQSLAKQPMEGKKTDVKPALTTSLELEDVASDDELKNDASFRSATETQSDLGLRVDHSAGSDIANQGTTTHSPKATAHETTDIAPPAPSASITNTAPEHIIVLPENSIVPAAAENEPSIHEPKATTMSPTSSEPIDTLASMQEEAAPSAVSPTATGPAKKSGAQHTESLHPFSKASKAQIKKEKEQKRKAQKKEKEQAEKARAARAAASKPIAESGSAGNGESTREDITGKSRTTDKAKVTVKNESVEKNSISSADKALSALAEEITEADSFAKESAPAAKTSKRAADSREKLGKCKGKKADTTVTGGTATAESKDDDHGKQTGGTISIPNETGSVTNKEVKLDLPEGDLAPDAQSSKHEHTKNASTGAKDSSPPVTTGEGSAQSAKKKNKKKKKRAPRVWPSLDFRPKSPNPPWMGPIDTATDVQHYETIINEACGGEEDSEFSWSDLPKMASSEEGKQSSASDEDGKGDGDADNNQDGDAIIKRIADLEAQQDAAKLDQQKRVIGEALYKVREMQPELASKVTGMLLDLNHDEVTRLTSDEHALSAKVEEAVISLTKCFNKDGEDATLEARIRAAIEGLKEASSDLAVADEQLPQRTGRQGPFNAAVAEPQPAKKKKPNKHRNKKKKKQQQPDAAAESAETAEPSKTSDTAETTEVKEPALNKAIEDCIDNDDPFYDQLKGIEAIKRGNHAAADAQDNHSQHHAEIAKSLADPQFMRTMEGYLKETQGRSQSKGRKVSKEDLL